MKKILTIITSLLFVFSVASCVNNNNDDNTPKVLTVKQAVDAMEEIENFRFEAVFKIDEVSSDENDMSYEVTLEVQDGKMKLVVPIPSISMSMTFYLYEKADVEYLIVNTAILSSVNPNLELDPWVEIPLTESDISGLMDIIGVKPPQGNPDSTEYQEVIDMINEIIDFFDNIKDEYFTLNDEGYFEFNKTGETTLVNIVLKHANGSITQADIDAALEMCHYSVKFKTNDKYLTSIKIELEAYEENEKLGTISLAGSFDRFNEVSFVLPTNTTPVAEFIEKIIQMDPTEGGTVVVE